MSLLLSCKSRCASGKLRAKVSLNWQPTGKSSNKQSFTFLSIFTWQTLSCIHDVLWKMEKIQTVLFFDSSSFKWQPKREFKPNKQTFVFLCQRMLFVCEAKAFLIISACWVSLCKTSGKAAIKAVTAMLGIVKTV